MKFAIFFILFSLTLEAASSWKEKVHALLPMPIRNFKLQSTHLIDVEKALGKAHLVEGHQYYWERDGFKYGLQLSFNDKKVLTSIHYTFTGERPQLSRITNQGDLKKLKPYPAEGKASGRFLILQEKEAQLIIDPLSKTIHTIKLP